MTGQDRPVCDCPGPCACYAACQDKASFMFDRLQSE